MKKIYTLIAFAIFSLNAFAQAPEKMSYQAVIRNSSNDLIKSAPVGMRISLIPKTATNPAVYVETQTPSTNANGLVSIEIGNGNVVIGSFSSINWANGPYFVKTETDPTGGTNYTITGVSQLLSSPYALYAKFAGSGTPGGFTHYLGEYFNGGIIFELFKGTDGKEHGLIVAISESSTALQWQSTASLVYASRTDDGAINTLNIVSANSPAKTYVSGFGFGWYIPSIDELAKLYYNRYYVQKGLLATSQSPLSNTATYWSSTELNSGTAQLFYFSSGHAGSNGKTSAFNVRAIKAF